MIVTANSNREYETITLARKLFKLGCHELGTRDDMKAALVSMGHERAIKVPIKNNWVKFRLGGTTNFGKFQYIVAAGDFFGQVRLLVEGNYPCVKPEDIIED